MIPPVTFLCTKCRYDLVGARTNICPACGAEFDRSELLRKLGREPLSIKHIAIMLIVAPTVLLIALLYTLLGPVNKEIWLAVTLAVGLIAFAAPLAATRMIYGEAVLYYKHWVNDFQSRALMYCAIFIVLGVVEATFLVAAYFVYYLGSMLR